MKRSLLIIGSEELGKAVSECAAATKLYDEITFMHKNIHEDIEKEHNTSKQKVTPPEYIMDNFDEVIAVPGLNNAERVAATLYLEKMGMASATIVHPTATIHSPAEIGSGTVILANSVIKPHAKIGKACLIGTGVHIEEHCTLSDGVQLSTDVSVAEHVIIGENTWLCRESSVLRGVNIGKNVIAGTWTVITQNIPDNELIIGFPLPSQKLFTRLHM